VRKKDFTIGNGATCRVRFSIQALISEIAVAQDLDIKLAFYPSGSATAPFPPSTKPHIFHHGCLVKIFAIGPRPFGYRYCNSN
jgi:hypothetical protein